MEKQDACGLLGHVEDAFSAEFKKAGFSISFGFFRVSALPNLTEGSYALGGSSTKEAFDNDEIVLLTSVSNHSFSRRSSMAEDVQASSLARSRIFIPAGVMLEAASKPIKAWYTACAG